MTSPQYILKITFLIGYILFTSSCLIEFASAQGSDEAVYTKLSKRSKSSGSTKIVADEANWNWEKREFNVKGSVNLQHGPLKITCVKATVTFDKGEALEKAQTFDLNKLKLKHISAQGLVRVTHKSLSLSAKNIDYSHSKMMVTVHGSLRGQWGDHRLSGQDLVINLKTETASVKRVEFNLLWPQSDIKQSLWGR